MNFCAKIGVCLFVLIAVILSLSGIASFSLEIAKIVLFNQTNGELKLHPIDYVYLCALFFGLSGFWCYGINTNKTNNGDGFSCLSDMCGILISLTILILYTIFTKDEMGDIPFFCPADYPYSSHVIRTACQVRAANLLLLWICPAIILLLVTIALIITAMIACCCATKEDCCNP